MTRRLVYIAFGAAAGVLAVRRASAAAARYTPAGVSHRLADSFGGWGETVREFAAEVRVAMVEREAELLRATAGPPPEPARPAPTTSLLTEEELHMLLSDDLDNGAGGTNGHPPRPSDSSSTPSAFPGQPR